LITYFPFIGWLVTMTMKKDDTLAMHHARQGFVLAVIFTAISVFLSFSTVFIPRNYRTVKLIIISLTYFFYLIYLILCIMGTLMIRKNSMGEIYFIGRLAKKIDV